MIWAEVSVLFSLAFITCLAFDAPLAPTRPNLTALDMLSMMKPPQLAGWGSNPNTLPTETTTTGWPAQETPAEGGGWNNLSGWSVETSTTPETPSGWLPETTTSGWSMETTTGWPEPHYNSSGWSVETTTGWPSPSNNESGWSVETTTGWPSSPYHPSGWEQDLQTDIHIVGESVVAGDGEAVATHESHTIVLGDVANPANAQFQTGASVNLGQGANNVQSSSIGSSGESATDQVIEGYNFGEASEYYDGNLSGSQISLQNSGASFVAGQGTLSQSGFTQNDDDDEDDNDWWKKST